MSNTEYGRSFQLRVDDRERHALARAVMDRIEAVSADLASGVAHYGEGCWQEPMREVADELRTLRSLLERLSD